MSYIISRGGGYGVLIMENNSIDKTRQDKTRQSNETNYPCQDMPKRIGNLYGDDRGTGFAGNVWNKNAISPTITTCQGGGREPMILDSFIVAMRGRNPEKPNDRTPGLPTEQRLEMAQEGMTNTLTTVQKDNLVLESCRMVRTEVGKRLRKAYENGEIKHGFNEYRELEPRKDGVCNTITTVQKDNLCLEIKKVGQISNDGSQYGTVISEEGLSSTAGTHGYANNCICVKQATKEGTIKCKIGGCYDASYPDSTTRRGRVQNGGDVTPTITAQGAENINYVETQYRIRKLTPKECWRLMGYTDEDFEKAAAVNSNTQLYKEAGNAIIKQVLMAIFLQMGIQGLKTWNDRSEEEKAQMIRGSIYDKADIQ